MAPQSTSAFLKESKAAEYLCILKKTLQCWRFNHKGPTYAKLNNKLIRYHQVDLDKWMKRQSVTHDQHEFI
ncbi:MAG: helix-turn-helix domain-containing protein [SAR324 cluster bacterium]|nr:helix-turn-helix domain-containing protein [SAR324 cluster bacterium]